MRFTIFVMLMSLFVACESTDKQVTSEVKPVLTGGYSQLSDLKNPNALKAISMVKQKIKEELKLSACDFNIENIDQQVVRGINYRMIMSVQYKTVAGEKVNKSFEATVWHDIDDSFKITHFEALND